MFLPKFFYKGFNDSFCRSRAGHPNALRGHLKRKQSCKVGNKRLGTVRYLQPSHPALKSGMDNTCNHR